MCRGRREELASAFIDASLLGPSAIRLTLGRNKQNDNDSSRRASGGCYEKSEEQ